MPRKPRDPSRPDPQRGSSALPDSQPWDRRHGETARAYAAFKHYCKLPPDSRALMKVAFDLGKSQKMIRDWSSRHGWLNRALAWDTHMMEVEQVQHEKVRAEFAEKWERRRLEAAEANWERAQRLALRAEEMLKAPLFEQVVDVSRTDPETGKTYPVQVTMQPAKWTFATAGAILKLAAELQAAAVIEATGGKEDDFDPLTATPDECRAYLAKQGVIKALPAPQEEED